MPTKRPRTARKPGRFRSLKVSDSFRDFVLDQLSDVPRLSRKAMFGGLGLYSDDVFFGILAADVLYLKVNDDTRAELARLGGMPFAPFTDRPMSMNYYGVPIGIVEDAPALLAWAKRAIAVKKSAAPRRARRIAPKRTR